MQRKLNSLAVRERGANLPTCRGLVIFSLTALFLAACGCGSGDETQSYSLVSVSGTVKMGGKPLEGAQMSFTPNQVNKPSTPGEAFTDSQGQYEAKFRGRSGLAPGKYSVTIAKLPTDKGQSTDPFMAQLAKDATRARSKDAAPPKVEVTVEKEVPAGGGTLDFDVPANASAGAASK